MSWHRTPNEPWHDRHAGHKGAQGKKPRCHTCLRPKSKCRCERFDNGPRARPVKEATDA